MVRDKSDFEKFFDPHGHLTPFTKNSFPAIFSGYLEFMRKMQKRFHCATIA